MSTSITGAGVVYNDGSTQTTSGKIVAQVQTFTTGTVATGTTVIPYDNTIPQNTEGDQYMSLAITPTNAASTLEISIVSNQASTAVTSAISGALFKDSTVDAIAAAYVYNAAAGTPMQIVMNHVQVAGTTSTITFKYRMGPSAAGTITFNGAAGVQLFGGVMSSRITIKEYLP